MGNWNLYYGLLPYIVLVAAGGFAADRWGRRLLSYLCLGMMGIAYTVYPRVGGLGGYLLTQTLMQGAFAFADLFVWVILADLAASTLRIKPPGSAQSIQVKSPAVETADRVYGLGLGMNILSILTGVLLSSWFSRLNMDHAQLASSITGVALFLVLIVLVNIPETLTGSKAVAAALPPPSHPLPIVLPPAVTAGLTPRESEIIKLVLLGKSNPDIARELNITPNTLKTHMRHIYDKTETANKRELLVKFLPNKSVSGS